VVSSSGGPSATGSSGGGTSAPAAGSGSATSGPRVEHVSSSRPWIGTTVPRQRRVTTHTFALPRATRVIFTVNQVSPACRETGHFSVAGRAGLNRVRFASRVHGRSLTSGTYRIAARTAAGRVLRRITLVVVGGSAPGRAELQSLRAANTCAARASSSGNSSSLPEQQLPDPMSQAPKVSSGLGVTDGPKVHGGVLATSVAILLLSLAVAPARRARRAALEPHACAPSCGNRRVGAAALIAVAVTLLVA
jgi:hypothetical protein